HPVIAATGEIFLCASKATRGTSYVVEGVAPVQEFIAVAGDGAAFATRDMLGILKAETSQITERAALAAFVFGEPGLAGILDHSQLVFARKHKLAVIRSEEHTSELQSLRHLVCRLLLEKKKN